MRDSYAFYTDKLTGEYRTVFDKIEMYIGTQTCDDITKEDKLSQLLDMFLSAQEEGKPVHKIVGGSVEEFCKTFCSDFGFEGTMLNILDMFKTLAWCFIVLSVFDIISMDWSTADDFFTTLSSVNISGYIIGFVLSSVIGRIANSIMCKAMFKLKRLSVNFLKIASLLVSVLVFVGLVWVINSSKTDFISCPMWIVLVCSIVYLVLYYLINHERLKAEKKNDIRFIDMVNQDLDEDLPKLMEEKYNTLNKRSIKRGKGELTMQAFLDKEEKDCDTIQKQKWLYYLMPMAITLIGFVSTYFTSGFDTVFDAVIFIAITLAIEFPIVLGIWRISKNGAIKRKAWIKYKREQLKNIP
ncbi:MAG: DUF1048 domain-containing protein [Ruminococcus sp.]|nr:DUF1048 domain-containing protein [Ruminococcus sp.]